jgi:endonuclease/exonuclease/phosphatase family metal-dependent hydrolase
MRLASYNLENLFDRAKALNLDTWAQGRPTLEVYKEVNTLLNEPVITPAIRAKILDDLTLLGILKVNSAGDLDRTKDGGPYALLRENRGRLLKKPQGASIQVVAAGRDDWIGWVELKTEAVNQVATQMTARVARDVDADVMALIEVESRIAVLRFNDQLLPIVGAPPYAHAMVIDGNDDRGIDVGIMTKRDYHIDLMRSHVDDTDASGQVFSRDCAEYEIVTPLGGRLLVLVNHLKSKGYGSQTTSNTKRKRQSQRVRDIYDARRAVGATMVAIVGDMNDTPASDPLSPLLGAGSDLKDISQHPQFQGDGRPGTYANGTASNKIDYVLLSPELFALTTSGGVFRQGVWGGVNGTLFPHYPEMTKAVEAASDHAAIWAEFNL